MTNDETAVIKTKHVPTTPHIDEDYILVTGAENSSRGVASISAAISAHNNSGVKEALERAECEYDPAEYDGGTVVARIYPDGTTEWPLEIDQ